MGIKLLNSLIKNYCRKSCKLTTLFELKNRTIVVDISIYMYRFKAEDKLIENIYLLCSIFYFYNIKVLFIFDGVPPQEKKNELKKRKIQKHKAREEFYKIKDNKLILKGDRIKMKKLRKIFTTINKNDIINVKKLISLWGMTHIIAEKEADELCAKLVICGKAYACLSEDTDLFVYGCPRVLRYLSIRNHTVVMYNLNSILDNLKLDKYKFRKICVISGTDYNSPSQGNIFQNYDLYKENAIILSDEDKKIYNIFCLKNDDCFENLLIENGPINKEEIKKIMIKYNFVFI